MFLGKLSFLGEVPPSQLFSICHSLHEGGGGSMYGGISPLFQRVNKKSAVPLAETHYAPNF